MDADASMVERRPEPQNVPDLLRVSPMDTTTATDVETSMLDPVVISDNFCRFTLLNKGILHSHSKVTLALENPDANDRFFPPNVGVASLIQRAALKVGTKTLQEIDGYNYLTAYKSMFISNEHQKQREQVQSGRCISHEFLYNDTAQTGAGGADVNTKALGYGLSNGREYDNNDKASTQDLRVLEFANIKNTPVFQIALSDLFPMLKTNQLPLYMMKEQVSIELTFEPASNNTRAQSASSVATSLYTIDQTQVKFIADYIYYPQEMMDAYAQQNRVISINHSDYRHSKVTVAHDVANSTQVRNLGGANRIVTKVITGLQSNAADDLSILNKYHAMCPEVSYTRASATGNNGSTTYNIKYNDRFLYPVDVVNSARHFHNTAQAEGIPPMVTREEYSAEGTGLTDAEFMGYALNEGTKSGGTTGRGIQGRFGWAGFRLNRNERVNSRGLEIYYKYLTLSTESAYTQRSWLELAKLTTIVDGYVQTQLA
jgi:hypothetical protein